MNGAESIHFNEVLPHSDPLTSTFPVRVASWRSVIAETNAENAYRLIRGAL